MKDNSLKDKWILIVDDDEDIREILGDQLVEYFGRDIRIVEASDGVQACMKIEFQKFDCIITDLNMPKRDGGQFVKEIRESENNKNCPVIVVTGSPDPDLLQDFPNMHFVEKPVKREVFTKMVEVQLKLGQLDKRVNADLFNYAVNSTRTIIGKIFNEVPIIESPDQKKSGDDLIGDVHVHCSVKGPTGICNFSLSFEEEFVNQLKEKTKAGNTLETVSLGASNVILKYILSSYHADHRKEKIPAIQKKEAFTTTDSLLYESIKRSGGMQVPISIGDFKVLMTMLTKMPA